MTIMPLVATKISPNLLNCSSLIISKNNHYSEKIHLISLFLVRHGESEWNRLGRIQGQADSRLTETGIEQAQNIGRYLTDILTGQRLKIYSGPLSRAYQTAVIIAENLDYDTDDIIVDERLNDYHQGEISGTYGWDTVAKNYPELARLRLEDPLSYHPPGGESGMEFRTRLGSFLDDLSDHETIHLVVSHGIVNKYIRSIKRNISGAGIIALGESQNTIYRLDADQETAINLR